MKIISICLGSLLLAQATLAQERRIIPRITGGINFNFNKFWDAISKISGTLWQVEMRV